MENRLIWNEQYNVGVDIIDKEHKKLFSILNKLFDFGHKEEKSHFACQEAIKYFKDHAIQHFADEEAYMVSINYPGLEAHRRIHKDFRDRMLPALEHELELTGFSKTSIHHFLGVCAGWLIGHTLIEDHMIVSGEPIRHWEKLLPEEEQTMMGQTIASLLHSMFRLDPQLISNCYAGEKFGNEICCHLTYNSIDRKKWEFFLLFEQELIGRSIGNVIDSKSEVTDMMLSGVAKYAAKQLAERIKLHFSPPEQFKMTGEQLLTYEQFYKTYERQSPQFSLLFDTGSGYFAFCMTSSETPRRRDGVSAVTQNAVAEIEHHLHLDDPSVKSEDHLTSGNSPAKNKDHLSSDNSPAKNESRTVPDSASGKNESYLVPGSTSSKTEKHRPSDSSPAKAGKSPHAGNSAPETGKRPHSDTVSEIRDNRKKKILVVDDSNFMRKTISDLLKNNYEVLTAASGMSAIGSITLDRPDLVLLDYEMPVCNGNQVLEMIRSEKDFTDIPVIFLTCRVDRESVKKALSLKPDGYLSKSLPAEAVKAEIDHFFEKKKHKN